MVTTFAIAFLVGGADARDFEIRVLSGRHPTGAVQAVAANGAITLAGGEVIPGGEWYSLRRVPGSLPAWPAVPQAEFNQGDRLVGTVASVDGDAVRLVVTFPGLGDQALRFPVSSLRAVWLAHRPSSEPDWLAGPRKRDLIQSRSGDLAQGALTGVDPARNVIRYQAAGRDQQMDLTRVAAIGFNTDLARVRHPKGPFYRLTLADGTRLSVMAVIRDGPVWVAQTMFKETLKVPAAHVVSVDVEQGRVVYLSNLNPTRYQYEPYDGEHFHWTADRAANGSPLRLRVASSESTFDRGVGLHAECMIAYALGGKYRRFEGLAGLDPHGGRRGDAVFAVLVDGKARKLPQDGRLTLATGALPVQINVDGAKELTIVIRRAKGGGVQDSVNLVDARLVP